MKTKPEKPSWELSEDEEGQYIHLKGGGGDAMFPVYLSEEPARREQEIQLILDALNRNIVDKSVIA